MNCRGGATAERELNCCCNAGTICCVGYIGKSCGEVIAAGSKGCSLIAGAICCSGTVGAAGGN